MKRDGKVSFQAFDYTKQHTIVTHRNKKNIKFSQQSNNRQFFEKLVALKYSQSIWDKVFYSSD